MFNIPGVPGVLLHQKINMNTNIIRVQYGIDVWYKCKICGKQGYNLKKHYHKGDSTNEELDDDSFSTEEEVAQPDSSLSKHISAYPIYPINWETASKCLMDANDGNIEAQYAIGYCSFSGIYMEQDAIKSVTYLNMAAEQGHAKAHKILTKVLISLKLI